jgi:hypothetical protein
MNEEELTAYAMATRPFRRTEEGMGEYFGALHFMRGLPRNGEPWQMLLLLVSADFRIAWEGRRSACCDDPALCFDLESRSGYAALFAMEFASLGASMEDTVRMTLDLHDALDREHHILTEPVDVAERHFRAVYPEGIGAQEVE